MNKGFAVKLVLLCWVIIVPGMTLQAQPAGALPDMVLVQGGAFFVGYVGGEKPVGKLVYKAVLDSFYISRHKVRIMDFVLFCQETNRTERYWGKENDETAVHRMSWFEAVEFCNWLSIRHGYAPCYAITGEQVVCDMKATGYRLPTEAEWEYAARGGMKGMGEDQSVLENINAIENLGKPNSLGLFGMAGYPWEWCGDWEGEYPQGTFVNPVGPASGERKIARGGMLPGDGWPQSAIGRYSFPTKPRTVTTSFRVVRRAQ